MPRRMTRRAALIGGAASAGVVAVGGATLLARRGDSPAADPGASPTPRTFTPTPEPTATTPAPSPTPVPRGGVMAICAPDRFAFDTFDAQRTGEVSVAEVLGRTHSRLIEWDDFEAATLRGDLANSWEQPDDLTITFRLRDDARWPEGSLLNGRAVTAEDVVANFERFRAFAADGLPIAQRAETFANVASVESPAAGIVTVRLARPDAFALGAFAGQFAFVQAPEAVAAFEDRWADLERDSLQGSGPWHLSSDVPHRINFVPRPGAHRDAYLDTLEVHEPSRVRDALIAEAIHEGITRDRREAAAVREAGGFEEFARFEREVVLSTFAIDGPPWNNPELLRAISGALHRTVVAERLFGGRAEPSGLVPPVHATDDAGFEAIPGTGPDVEAEAEGARSRWEAAGGPALGTVVVDFPSIFDPLYSASSVVIERLNEVLGDQFRPAVETYTLISERVGGGYYGNGRAAFWLGWSPPLPSPDPGRWFISTYRPGAETAGLDVGPFDRLALEYDGDERARILQEAAEAVANDGFAGVIPWVQQRSEVFRRVGFEGGVATPFWGQHHDVGRFKRG